jgi:hypothetical protein
MVDEELFCCYNDFPTHSRTGPGGRLKPHVIREQLGGVDWLGCELWFGSTIREMVTFMYLHVPRQVDSQSDGVGAQY